MISVIKKMAQNPSYQDLGPIPYPKSFSARCCDIFNESSVDQCIKRSHAFEYDLEYVPEQFHPTILKAIDIHEAERPEQRNCWLHYNQGVLQLGETFRIADIHFDAWTETYPSTDYRNNDVFLVSDALPTQFYVHPFAMPEEIDETGADLNVRIINEINGQKDTTRMVTPPPYHLIRYDSFTVHRAQIPTVETPRTFLMVRFF